MPNETTVAQIAAELADARQNIRALNRFPGEVPTDLPRAYAIQQQGSRLLPGEIGGWKVGMIQPHLREALGDERFLGPVLARNIKKSLDEEAVFEAIPGGSAAFEAEFIFKTNRSVGRDEVVPLEHLAEAFSEVCIGIEVLISPLSNIGALGSGAIVADQGYNGGLVLGASVPDWRQLLHDPVSITVTLEDGIELAGGSNQIQGGLEAALDFAIHTAATTPRGLHKGDWISSGALTGLHPARQGSKLRADFGRFGVVRAALQDPHGIGDFRG